MTNPVKVIAITGGKGGVGKSNISVNLAVALAEINNRVVILDADFGLANIDILLGLTSRYTIDDVLLGLCQLQDILIEGPKGIQIVPASSGTQRLTQLNPQEHAGIIQAFSDIADAMDILIIDTAAGISASVMNFSQAAQEVIIVITGEPTSIADAYAQIKLFNRQYGLFRFRIIVNMVKNDQEGAAIFAKLTRVTEQYLEVALQYVGAIPYDDSLKKAVHKRTAVLELYPRSASALAIRGIARKVNEWSLPSHPRGHLEFFVDKLIQDSKLGQSNF